VDREFLEKCIAEGMSLPEIGRIVQRDPSTVGYWVEKYGLVANGKAKYAPRGGIPEQVLRELVEDGATLKEMAKALGRSISTIHYWLGRYGFPPRERGPKRRRNPLLIAAKESGIRVLDTECLRHGLTEHVLLGGRYRCRRCNSEAVARRRRKVKQILVAEAGGCCAICGYDRMPWALHFHHLDPSEKAFTISRRGITRGIAEVRAEARKCVLLCANCHAEVEAGFVEAPTGALPKGPLTDESLEFGQNDG
jgi:transposase